MSVAPRRHHERATQSATQPAPSPTRTRGALVAAALTVVLVGAGVVDVVTTHHVPAPPSVRSVLVLGDGLVCLDLEPGHERISAPCH